MKDYIKANISAYNDVAKEYGNRLEHYRKSKQSQKVNEPFIEALQKNFSTIRVLELGPGSGLDLTYFQKAGFKTTAIDLAAEMIKIAKKISPKTKFILDDFLTHNFKKQKFQGIFAKAFIHNFPSADAVKVMVKIKKLLVPKGIIYINTTKHTKPIEGYYLKKRFGSEMRRYRKKWTESELKKLIVNSGFKIISINYHFERDKGKQWMYFVAQK